MIEDIRGYSSQDGSIWAREAGADSTFGDLLQKLVSAFFCHQRINQSLFTLSWFTLTREPWTNANPGKIKKSQIEFSLLKGIENDAR